MTGPTLSSSADEVRRFDNDRFVTALFAPEDAREGLFAVYAFNLELARIRERIREPLLGQMRLTWWGETIDRVYAGLPAPGQPGAAALAAAIHRHGLSRSGLERLIEGRRADMDDAAPADLAALTGYAAATAGTLATLALEVLGAAEEPALKAAEHVAVAWALIGLLRAVPFHAASRRVYLPADLSRDAGLDVGALFERGAVAGLDRVVERVAAEAEGRLSAGRALRREIPRAALPVLLVAPLADAYLSRLARCRFDPFAPPVQRRPNAALVRIAVNAARGRY
ncbi:MAG: squalene/phytoene synthase family protein [Rhodospirillales bacterium]